MAAGSRGLINSGFDPLGKTLAAVCYFIRRHHFLFFILFYFILFYFIYLFIYLFLFYFILFYFIILFYFNFTLLYFTLLYFILLFYFLSSTEDIFFPLLLERQGLDKREEKERERERERERNTYVREKHWLVAFCTRPTRDWTCNLGMCSDSKSNLQPFGLQDNAQPTGSHWPGRFLFVFVMLVPINAQCLDQLGLQNYTILSFCFHL